MAQPDSVLAMKGMYEGRRAFMVGNGPSLLEQMDVLPLLDGEITVTCNYIYRWMECPFTPTYWGITEPDIKERHRRTLEATRARWPDVTPLFFHSSPDFLGADAREEGWTWVERSEQMMQHDGFAGLGDTLGALPTGWTTPLTMAQLMAWCGVREFYFIGMDISDTGWTYALSGRTLHERSIKAIRECFARARADIEAVGGSIVNCTPGSRLGKVIEYRPLEEVLSGQLVR